MQHGTKLSRCMIIIYTMIIIIIIINMWWIRRTPASVRHRQQQQQQQQQQQHLQRKGRGGQRWQECEGEPWSCVGQCVSLGEGGTCSMSFRSGLEHNTQLSHRLQATNHMLLTVQHLHVHQITVQQRAALSTPNLALR